MIPFTRQELAYYLLLIPVLQRSGLSTHITRECNYKH